MPRTLLLLLPLLLSACTLFEPITHHKAGIIAGEELASRPGELGELPQHNRDFRERSGEAVATTPARAGSGIVGEIDIGKAVRENQKDGGGKKAKGKRVTLDFSEASLKDIIVVFMQDYLKQPYVFQDSFKDRKVNLFFDAEATRDDLVQLFDTLLDSYGVRLRYNGDAYLIGAADDKAAATYQPSPLGIGDAIGIFLPRFVDGKDVIQIAKQFVKQGDRISVAPGNVLIVNSTSADVRAVANLLREIDVPAFTNKRIIVYVPRYLSAAGLVATLDSYHTQLAGGGGNKQFESKQVPDTERVVIVTANPVARDLVMQFLAQTDVVNANQRRVFQYSLGTQTAVEFATNLSLLLKPVFRNPTELVVVPDKVSNSLFIYASPDEFAEIRKILARMDFRPPAVQIEVVIAEVNLTNRMRYGVEWFLKSTGSWLADMTARLGIENSIASGLSAGIVSPSNAFATLQLIGSETSFALLSSPKIVVRNGATARINVGREQPVIKQKTINNNSAGNNTVIEPEFKKIGLELEVTPWVTQANEVRMIIKLKDTSIVGNEILGSDSYPILANRELQTDLVTADGSTIFLGGIRKQDVSDISEKIPGLGDHRILGIPFRNKAMEDSGQELIILATPVLMLDQQGADIVTGALLKATQREMNAPRAMPPVDAPPAPSAPGA